MHRSVSLVLLCLAVTAVRAELPGVRHWQSTQNLETVYESVYKSLEDSSFYVVFEPDIGSNLARSAGRWGEDYNRSGLDGIRAMVFCNGWYANQVSNRDPRLLALCPLHLTLYEQSGVTHVVFLRPTHAGSGSGADELLGELEADVSKAIEQGIEAAGM